VEVEMPYREVERLKGMATILRADGSEVGRRPYHLTIWQQMLDAGGEQIPGLFQIEGRIDLQEMEGYSLVIAGELILKLEDGRSLPFFFTNNDGRIAARGQLE
jgi:hypothetical protein